MVHTKVRKLTFSSQRENEIEQWCLKYIGPRLYWLHNKRGGHGWKIQRNSDSWELEVEDGKQLIMAILKFGDK